MTELNYLLRFTLKSDTIFGRGDGVAGEVDDEVMHDDWGFPYLGGRAIKGILVNECADILAALPSDERLDKWQKSANRLFGSPGSTLDSRAILSIGDAQIPEEIRARIKTSIEKKISQELKNLQTGDSAKSYQQIRSLYRKRILDDFTTTRHQTAMEMSGVPKEHSLRVHRVIFRETSFEARLVFSEKPTDADIALLSACVRAFRRVGSNRNRGLGRIEASITDSSRKDGIEKAGFQEFKNDFAQGGAR
jgi:CRISPR/Cas system CSM-associated protein Csm3 (group 7 of RAMP superfamily)